MKSKNETNQSMPFWAIKVPPQTGCGEASIVHDDGEEQKLFMRSITASMTKSEWDEFKAMVEELWGLWS